MKINVVGSKQTNSPSLPGLALPIGEILLHMESKRPNGHGISNHGPKHWVNTVKQTSKKATTKPGPLSIFFLFLLLPSPLSLSFFSLLSHWSVSFFVAKFWVLTKIVIFWKTDRWVIPNGLQISAGALLCSLCSLSLSRSLGLRLGAFDFFASTDFSSLSLCLSLGHWGFVWWVYNHALILVSVELYCLWSSTYISANVSPSFLRFAICLLR